MDISNEKIKTIALENGFKLKEQPNGEMDLNPYVYRFARDLLNKSTIDFYKSRSIGKTVSFPLALQWICLKDHKPRPGQKVLLFRPHANKKPHGDPVIKIATHVGNGLFIGSHFEHLITYWMPIPECPLQDTNP